MLWVVSKQAGALAALSPAVAEALRRLGENLALARAQRQESQRPVQLLRQQRVRAKRLDVRRASERRALRSAAAVPS